MSGDREIARHALDVQARARDFRMMDLPGYMEWSERKLAEGGWDALIANLDATRVWCLPEEAARMTEQDYEKFLKELKEDLGRDRV